MVGQRHFYSGLFLVLGALVAGCSTYKAPELPAGETALLKGKEGCLVTSVDGQSVVEPLAVTVGGMFGGNEVRVTPGTHQIMISQSLNNGQWTYARALLCERNHTYTFESKTVLGGELIVRDATTGQLLQMPAMVVAAPATSTTASTQPITAPSAAAAVPAEDRNGGEDNPRPHLRIRTAKIRSASESGQAGIRATAEVTLDNVPKQPFTLQGILTDAQGNALRDAAGDFRGSRTVVTSDDEDTDTYSFFIPCQRIDTWKSLPSAVYVKLTLVDEAGKTRASLQPVSYTLTGR